MKAFIVQKRLYILAAAAILAGGAIIWYVAASGAPTFPAVAVTRGDVVASVSDPATVSAENNVQLSFQEAGQIAAVYVKEGDTVAEGATIAELDASALKAALEEKSAALAAAQATLDELQTGTRPEQLQIDESAVANASASLAIAVANAYVAADDAITNQTDNLFSSPQSDNPTLLVPTSDSQSRINVQNERVAIGATLEGWYGALHASSSAPGGLSKAADAALAEIGPYLDEVATIVNGVTPSALPAATLAAYKADVAAARSEVGGTMTALAAAESAYANAENELNLAQAGATPQAIEAQKAAVQEAQAAAASAQVALDHAVLRAPFGGTVQDLTAVTGQVVSAGVPVASLVNNSGLKVVSYASEADVATVKPGDQASVTLDAYGVDTAFSATVTTVDAGETEVNGAPAYKVTLHFTKPDGRLKDGMTGTVTIVTAEHDNVIAVPSRLVINDGGTDFVLVARGRATEQRPVTVGLVGTNGLTEIAAGLSEGDELVNF